MARLTISMLGGDCGRPIDWRRIDSTVTMKGKQVIMMAMPGASEIAVSPSDRAASDRRLSCRVAQRSTAESRATPTSTPARKMVPSRRIWSSRRSRCFFSILNSGMP